MCWRADLCAGTDGTSFTSNNSIANQDPGVIHAGGLFFMLPARMMLSGGQGRLGYPSVKWSG